MARRKKIYQEELEQNLLRICWAITWLKHRLGHYTSRRLDSQGVNRCFNRYILGALLMIVIAISYSALVEKFLYSGAFAFGYLGFGKYVSFFSSWFLAWYICIVALNATFSLLFKFVMPVFEQGGYTLSGWDVYITEIILSSLILLIFA